MCACACEVARGRMEWEENPDMIKKERGINTPGGREGVGCCSLA